MYHATLSYLCRALRNLVKWADRENIPSIGQPKIGTGLGKLSWQLEVKPLMEEHFAESRCRFIVYEEFTLEGES